MGRDGFYSVLIASGTTFAIAGVFLVIITWSLGAGFALTQVGPALRFALPAGLITAIFSFSARRRRHRAKR